jgi:hypothetical protein
VLQQEGSAEHTRMRTIRTKMTIPRVMDDISAMLAFVEQEKEATALRRSPKPGAFTAATFSPPTQVVFPNQ